MYLYQVMHDGSPEFLVRTSTPETVAAIRHTWGFDKPIYDQLFGAFFVVALSAVVDIVVALLDPRVKLSV